MEKHEKHILMQIAQGDVKAFEELFFRYQPKLVNFLEALTHDREISRDMVQEMFLDMWKERKKLRQVDSISAYLFRVARCKAYDYFDHLLITEKYAKDYLSYASEETSEEEKIFVHELQSIIRQTVSNLPPQKQQIYRLSRENGLSNEVIAQRLGISKRTVENHLSAILAILRKVIYIAVFSF